LVTGRFIGHQQKYEPDVDFEKINVEDLVMEKREPMSSKSFHRLYNTLFYSGRLMKLKKQINDKYIRY